MVEMARIVFVGNVPGFHHTPDGKVTFDIVNPGGSQNVTRPPTEFFPECET